MSRAPILFALAALTLGVLAPPALVAGPGGIADRGCADVDDSACCGADCSFCLCCSHPLPFSPPAVRPDCGRLPAGACFISAPLSPPEPPARDVLHVPRAWRRG